jgi:ABC-type transporter MlaC component
MIKKVYKYATGDVIPEGAVYLSTQVEKFTEAIEREGIGETKIKTINEKNLLVWHYFLVEVKE